MNAFEAMDKASQEKGWPSSYRNDLYKHDRELLESEDAPEKFGWVLRELGTYLLDVRMDLDALRGYFGHLDFNVGRDYNEIFFTWDGERLIELPYKEWKQWMRDNHEPSDNSHHNSY